MPGKNGRPSNWVKNFGKSVRFSAVEVLSELAPSTKDTAQNASGVVQDLVKDLRGLKIGQSKILQELNKVPAFRYSKEWWKNMKSDLKSGKINNQDRLQRMADADMEDFDTGDDFEFNADDADIEFSPGPEGGSDDEFSVSDDMAEAVKPIAQSLQPGVNATANATRHTAIAVENMAVGQAKQTNMIASGFDATNKLNTQIAASNFSMMSKFHEERMDLSNNMNSNLEKIVQFNDETISKLAMGALKFYDDQINVSNNILAELQRIREAVAPEKPQNEEVVETPQASQLFTGRGIFKMSKYPEILKKNFMAAADEDFILSSMKTFLTDEMALKSMAANPLGFISTKIATGLIPEVIKTTLKELDTTVAGFFPALFAKINSGLDSDNPVKQLLAKIFGIRTDVATSANFDQYEKGAVPFDGITRTAITTVIPNYLASILAALTGREEKAFDYDKGTFTTRFAMQQEQEEQELTRLTSSYGKVISDMTKSLSDKVEYKNDEIRKQVHEDMMEVLKNLTLGQKFVNLTDANKIKELGASDDKTANLLAGAFQSLTRGKQMSVFNSMFKAGVEQNDYYTKALKDNPAALINLLNTRGGLEIDPHLSRSASNKWSYKLEKGSSPFLPLDEFGNSQLDYLRDIKDALIEGIITYPQMVYGGGKGKKKGGSSGGSPVMDQSILDRKTSWKNTKEADKRRVADLENSELPTNLTAEEIEEARKNGKLIFGEDIKGKTASKLISEQMKLADDAKANPDKRKMGGFYQWFDKMVNADSFGERVDEIKKSVAKFMKTPVNFIVDKMESLDKTLYAIIYGDPDTGEGIVKTTIEKIKNTFDNLGEYLKKKYDDFSKWLFGEQGFKSTQAYKWISTKSSELFDYLFGTKNDQGNRTGGAFSGTFNALKDFGFSVRHELFGTPYKDADGNEHTENKSSVMHNIKTGLNDAFGAMKEYLFGPPEKNKDGTNKSFMDQVTDTLGTGFNNWKNFIFGTKTSEEDGKAEFKEIAGEFKAKLPKALAVGVVGAGVGMFTNFGLLGSLFLPGGPIGGMILGTALGFASQSEKFKSFVFGPKGVDGKRMGGIISKGVIDWVTAHKTVLLGGATFGAVKGLIGATGVLNLFGPLGYMANFLLPGGPIGGALLGAAVGIGWKSKTFQEFLYGKEGEDGKKMGGILNSEMGKGMKKHLSNMAFGALSFGAGAAVLGQMGFMGMMLTPGGPLGAAILGAAAGFGISSEKFRKFLFGDIDEKTGVKKSGLFDQVKNVFSLEIAAPFKLQLQRMSENIRYWFVDSIAIPFKASLKPLQTQFKLMVEDFKGLFKRGWQYLTKSLDNIFERAVGMPLAKFMVDKVLNPMKSFMNRLVNGIGKIFGAIISSPFKALYMLSNSLVASQQARGVKENRDERKEAFKSSISDFGKSIKRSFGISSPEDEVDENGNKKEQKGFLESLKDVWKSGKTMAKGYGREQTEQDKKKYADYAEERQKEIDEERAKNKAKRDKRIAELDNAKSDLNQRQHDANANNYHTHVLDKDGNVIADISDIYNLDKPLNDVKIATDLSNSHLDQIKHILANIGFKLTGDKNLISYADKAPKPGAPAPTPPKPDQKDEKHAEIAKEQQEDSDKAHEQAKIAEQSLSPEEKREGETPEVPGSPEDSASKVKRFSLRNLFGKGFKFKFTKSEDVEHVIDMVSAMTLSDEDRKKADNVLDRLMSNFIRRSGTTSSGSEQAGAPASGQAQLSGGQPAAGQPAGAPQSAKQQRAAANAASVAESSEDRQFDSKKGIGKGGDDVLKYLRIIASNVDGQLDGVGSNVYKTRKILESMAGMSSDDITGSANRDRKGIMGKIRGFIFDMVFNPIKFIGNIVKKPFEIIFDLGKKIYNGFWSLVDGAKNAVTGIISTGWSLVKQAGSFLLEIPKMGLDVIKGVAEVGKEVLKEGVKVIGEGLVGITKAAFGILEGAGKSIGKTVEGIGSLLKGTMEGIGKLGKEIFRGVGKAISGAVDIVAEVGKGAIAVGSAIAEGATKIFSSGVENVTKLATKLIGGVTDLLIGAGQTLFSVVSSPFKFLGKMGSSLIQRSSHVIIDGGSLDRIQTVDVVELVRNVNAVGGKVPDVPKGEHIPGGASTETPGAPATEETKKVVSKAEEKLKSDTEEKPGQPANSESGEKKSEEKSKTEEKPGKPATSNITADMATSGLVQAGGSMQRSAANMKAIAAVNENREIVQDNEVKQTGILEKILASSSKRNDFWGKLLKWLAMAGLWLKSHIGGILPLIGSLAGAIAGKLKEWGKVLAEEIINGIKKLLPKVPEPVKQAAEGVYKAASSAKNAVTNLAKRGYNLAKDGLTGLRNRLMERFGKKAGEEITEDVVETLVEHPNALPAPKVPALPQPKVPALPAPKVPALPAPASIKPVAIPVQAVVEDEFGNVIEVLEAEVVEKEVPGAIAQRQGGEALKAVAEENAEKAAPRWIKFIQKGIQELEKLASKVTGKPVTFASKLFSKISEKLTGDVMAKNAGRLAAAEAKGAAGDASFGVGYAIIGAWNTIAGLHDAANLFRVNSEAVTVPMRLCAALVKVVLGWPTIPMCLFDAALLIVGSLVGWNPYAWFAQTIYGLISDTKAIQDLEAMQKDFEKEALEAGYVKKDENGKPILDASGNAQVDVDAYNDEVNKTLFSKAVDKFVAGKDLVGEKLRNASSGIDNNLAWLFGQNDWETGEFKKGAIAEGVDSIKSGIGNNLAWLFGQNNWETGEFEKGVFARGWDSLSNGIDNNLAWLFGQNDWETGEFKPGVFNGISDKIIDKIDNELDYLLGKIDPTTGEVVTKGLFSRIGDKLNNEVEYIFGVQDAEKGTRGESPLKQDIFAWWGGGKNSRGQDVKGVWPQFKEDFWKKFTDIGDRLENHFAYIFGVRDAETMTRGESPLKRDIIAWWVGGPDSQGNEVVGMWPRIKGKFNDLWNPIAETFEEISNSLMEKWTNWKSEFDQKEGFEAVTYVFTSAFGLFLDYTPLGMAIKGVINAGTKAYEWIMQKLNELGQWWQNLDIKKEAKDWLKKLLPDWATSKSEINYTGGRVHDSIEWLKDKKNKAVDAVFGGPADESRPYYSQNDPRWKSRAYGGKSGFGDMGDAGCWPAVAATMAEERGVHVTPPQAADFAVASGHRVVGGTSESAFHDFGQSIGLNARKLDFDTALRYMDAGKSVAIGGTFDGMQHYVEGVQRNADGTYQIQDPRGRTFGRNMSEATLRSKAKTMYTFTGAGFGSEEDKMDAEAPKTLPLFRAWDDRWGEKGYRYSKGGSNSMTQSGCGPTAMAMIASWASGKEVMPMDVADWMADNGFHVSGGTSYGAYDAYAKQFGFTMETTSDKSKVLEALGKHIPVISGQGPGVFTKNSHMVVIAGKRADGSIIVYDPNVKDPGEGYTEDQVFGSQDQAYIPVGANGSNVLVGGAKTTLGGGTATAGAAASGGDRPKGLLDLMSDLFGSLFNAVDVGASGKVWTKQAASSGSNVEGGSVASPAGEATTASGAGPAPGKGVENIPKSAPPFSIPMAERASKVSGIPADWIWAQWANEAGPDFNAGVAGQGIHNYAGLTVTPSMPGLQDGGMRWGKWDSDDAFADYFGKYILKWDSPASSAAKNMHEYVDNIQNQTDGSAYCTDPPGTEPYYKAMVSRLGNTGTVIGAGKGDKFMKFIGGGEAAGEGTWWVRQGDWVSLDGAQPSTLGAIADMGKFTKEKTGEPLVITAVTNGSHAGGTYSHANGWKIDCNSWGAGVSDYFNTGGDFQPRPKVLQEFVDYGHSIGLGVNDEGDHIDIQTGNNGYEWQTGQYYGGYKNPNGNMTSAASSASSASDSGSKSNSGGSIASQPAQPKGFMETMSSLMGGLFDAVHVGASGKVWTPGMSNSGGSSGGGSYGESNTTASDMDKKAIWDWFHQKGYNDEATAGIMGRMQQEHNFNPAWAPLKRSNGVEVGGMGMFQWTWDRGEYIDTEDPEPDLKIGREKFPNSRLANYLSWADDNKRQYESASSQLDYLWNKDLDSQKWTGHTFRPDEMNALDRYGAADLWTKKYERGCVGNEHDYADEIYNQFKGSGKGDFFGSGPESQVASSWLLESMLKGLGLSKYAKKKAEEKKEAETVDEVAPNGKKYEKNDVEYLLKQGFTREAALDLLSKDPKYAKTDESMIAPNGLKYEQNDIDYLLKQGYTKESAIAFLATVDKYTKTPATTDQKAGDVAKDQKKPEKEKLQRRYSGIGGWIGGMLGMNPRDQKPEDQPKDKSKYKRRHGGIGGWLGGMLGINRRDVPIEEKKEAETKAATLDRGPNAAKLLGVTQKDVSEFKGGEYFNDNARVTLAARTYIKGVGTLDDVARSIGFDKEPSDDTPLDAYQQQALGYREYSKVRTWAHYKIDSKLWKSGGMTSVDRWLTGGVDPFAGGGPELGFGSALLQQLLKPLGLFGQSKGPEKKTGGVATKQPTEKKIEYEDEVAPNGSHYEKNDVEYLLKQGYTRDDAIAYLSTVDKYLKPADSLIAPNGLKYEQNDIDYLLKQGYTKDDAIAFLATADKYTKPVEAASKEAAKPASAEKLERRYSGIGGWIGGMFGLNKRDQKPSDKPVDKSKFKRRHGGIGGWLGGMLGINRRDVPIEEPKKPESKAIALDQGPNAATLLGVTQKDISEFKGGEYFNDPSRVTVEARMYVKGQATIEDVAHSIGFEKIPEDSTPLTVYQQQALGFREYNKIRTWAHYVSESNLWKNSGMTSLDRWMTGGVDPFAGGGVGDRMEKVQINGKWYFKRIDARTGRVRYIPINNPESIGLTPNEPQSPVASQPEPPKPTTHPQPVEWQDPTPPTAMIPAARVTAEEPRSLEDILNFWRRKHGKKEVGNASYVGSQFIRDNLHRDTSLLGVTQKHVNLFEGGEYFNDSSKVALEARLYLKGQATLEDVAKAIGFDGIPSDDTLLTPGMQQALGFREYNKIRTWAHYVSESNLWKNSGMTSLDRWMTGGVDPFAGGGVGDPLKESNVQSTVGSNKLRDTLNFWLRKHGKQEITGKSRYIGSKMALENLQRDTVFNGITQAKITSFKGGEYFNAEDKIAPEAKDYVRGKGDLFDVARAIGFSEVPADDLPLTAGMQQLLGYREYNPVRTWSHYVTDSQLWKRGGLTSAERWIQAQAPLEKTQPSDSAPAIVDKVSTESEVGKALEELRKVQEKQEKNQSTDMFSKMVELLGAIATNTGGFAEGLKDLKNAGNNPIIVNNGDKNTVPVFLQHANRDRIDPATLQAMSNPKTSKEYQRQVLIASGGEFKR